MNKKIIIKKKNEEYNTKEINMQEKMVRQKKMWITQ